MIYNNWHSYLQKELSPEIADSFFAYLCEKSDNNIAQLHDIFADIAFTWAPLLIYFEKWIKKNALYPIFLLQRDGDVINTISDKKLPDIYITRALCGIYDEIAQDTVQKSPYMQEYLQQKKLFTPFTCVDSGSCGTIIQHLYVDYHVVCQPLFFFSHNPYIKSFLTDDDTLSIINSFTKNNEKHSLDFRAGLNDFFESVFPKRYKSPKAFKKTATGKITPILNKNDALSLQLYATFSASLKQACDIFKNNLPPLENVLGILYDEYLKTPNSYLTVAPSIYWSKKDAFFTTYHDLVIAPQEKTI